MGGVRGFLWSSMRALIYGLIVFFARVFCTCAVLDDASRFCFYNLMLRAPLFGNLFFVWPSSSCLAQRIVIIVFLSVVMSSGSCCCSFWFFRFPLFDFGFGSWEVGKFLAFVAESIYPSAWRLGVWRGRGGWMEHRV